MDAVTPVPQVQTKGAETLIPAWLKAARRSSSGLYLMQQETVDNGAGEGMIHSRPSSWVHLLVAA